MGGAVSTGQDNDDLIDNLLQADYIRSPAVERVFRAVDRGDYFLPDARGNAYKDLAWKCGHLHLSAPCIYSEVIEGLCLCPGLSFLNLGSGTGYLSTMVGLILGSHGINHGVEIHDDVIQYANKKLEDFKKYSGAVDEFDFCEPKFVQGNCLCLTTERQYDRVYCGASCPEPYESYMKNLLRVGGILVMPLNEHLVQIKRTTEITWDVCSLFPVSFATLVYPHDVKQEVVEMLEVVPLSLQSLSRAVIRSILRKNIELENPDLKKRTPTVKQSKRKERALRRLVVPIFDDSGDDMLSSDGEERARHNRRSANNIFDIVMDHLGYRVRGRHANLRRQQERNAGSEEHNNGGNEESNGVNEECEAGNVASLSNAEEEMEVDTDNNSTNNSNDNEPIPPVRSEVQAVIEPQPNISNMVSTDENKTEEPVTEKDEDTSEEKVTKTGDEKDLLVAVVEDKRPDQEMTTEQVENDIDQVFLDVLQDFNRRRNEEDELQEDLSNLEVLTKESEKCNVSDDKCEYAGETNANLEAGTSSANAKKKANREKFDSGFGEEIIEKNVTNSDSSDHENMEFESSSSSNEDNDGKRNKRGSKNNTEVRSGAKWRRVCFSAPRYDSLSSSDSETVQEEVVPSASRIVSSPYTPHMRTKIQQLPLPPILKNYLNFYREF